MAPVKKKKLKNLHVWITVSDGAALKLSAYNAVWTFSKKKTMPTCCIIVLVRHEVLGKNKSFRNGLERERKRKDTNRGAIAEEQIIERVDILKKERVYS